MQARSERPTNRRRYWPLLFLGALVILALTGPLGPGAVAQDSPSATSKITDALRDQFAQNPAGKIRYIAVLSTQANVANNITDWNAQGRYVLDTLRNVANATQPPVTNFLNTQIALGNVERFKAYYIVNAFQVRGNLASAEALAALPEISTLDIFPVATIEPPAEQDPLALTEAIEWNVQAVRAPQAWAKGYDGSGVVVGSLDTGVRYTHRSLAGKYNGNLGGSFDHNYNWWDAIAGRPEPYDDNGHGTHTVGTILGDDGAGNQTGVAPGARWIATNGIADGTTEADIVEAFQFMLAPWDLSGQNPDPSKRPVVVSNSWGYGVNLPYPGCSTATIFRDMVQAWVSASIFPSFSAGNGTYGNRPPAAYPETFETGSLTRLSSTYVRSYFSSQGPSCYDAGQHPQVMAGGDGVRSASHTSDDGYRNLSGTSMAQPALAGAVAVLKQANPNLTIQQTWNILTSTAYMDPAWEAGIRPNPEYGWGLVQLDKAVDAALALLGPPTATPAGTPPTATPTNTPTDTPQPTNTPVPPTATPVPACVITVMSADVPKPIPDLVTIQSTLTVESGPIVSSVEVVDLSITHTYPEDLNVYLISPSGTRVKLFSDVCAGGDWTLLNDKFSLGDGASTRMGATCPPRNGYYQPHSPLAAFIGEPSTGIWTLEITDDFLQDIGVLHSWGLRIGGTQGCPSSGEPTATPTEPAPTNTPTPTATATNTPEPCSTCNLSVESVTTSCNLDGTIRWTATVRNNSNCTVNAGWQAQLQTKKKGEKFAPVLTDTGTGSFPPGVSVVSGDFCYSYQPNTTGQRTMFILDTTGEACQLGGKSDVTQPCEGAGNCQ